MKPGNAIFRIRILARPRILRPSAVPLFLMWVILLSPLTHAAEKKGGLVLQFDDGWSSWATFIAPELEKVGGKATGFINNQNIANGRITAKDLRTLQNTYHWEIGTHTWHHLNAPGAIRKNGMAPWLAEELIKSITELRALGLTVNALAFPFNAYNAELVQAVQPLVESYRRPEPLAIADTIAADKSVPATAIDMAHYVPPALLKKWVDLAASKDSLLFLYGHRVLPDSSFVTGRVVSVTTTTLTADQPVILPEGSSLVLVPDISRRPPPPHYFQVISATNATITVDHPDLTKLTSPGAIFMIGEAYSTRLSDFRTLLEYAAERMPFYTLHEVAGRNQKTGVRSQ